MTSVEVLSLLQEHAIRGMRVSRTCIEVGGFVAAFHDTEEMVYMNPAFPVQTDGGRDVESLLAAYAERGRKPWLEFAVELWPEVVAELEASGLQCVHRMPVMVLARSEWEPRDSAAREPRADEVREFMEAGLASFGVTESVKESQVERTRKSFDSGRVLASLVEKDERIVSVGQAVGTAEVREVAGLGTLEAYRRQGYCTAVIQDLLARHFGGGGEVAWLTPGDEGARRVYEKSGFRPVGTQVTYALEPFRG
jgi:predicted GNAT family acetyltransferase